MRAALAANVFLISNVCGAFAQPADPPPAFEVASVKPSPRSGENMRVQPSAATDPGGVTLLNQSLKAMVQWAYHMQSIQVTGPGWIDSNRYDIVAKAPGPSSDEQLRRMMQTLLADRFKLAFHHETKEMQAYVVTVAKTGHKLKPSEGDGPMDLKPTGKGLMLQFTHVTLAQLAEMAQSPLQGVVIDQTGLKGAWDFTIDASFFAMQKPADLEEAISMIIQVMNDQLGIKVDQKRVPAELIVIDRAEKIPSEN
jgi:uncharacterized protein (TIGR03435 family)